MLQVPYGAAALAVACASCAGARHLHHQLPCMNRHLANAASWLLTGRHASACIPGSCRAPFPVGAYLHVHSLQLCPPATASVCSISTALWH